MRIKPTQTKDKDYFLENLLMNVVGCRGASVGIHAEREDATRNRLNVERAVAGVAECLLPLALHSLRNVGAHGGVMEAHTDQVTLVLGIVDKAVATVKNSLFSVSNISGVNARAHQEHEVLTMLFTKWMSPG